MAVTAVILILVRRDLVGPFFLAVAPLQYFSVHALVVWRPDKVIGILLLAYWLVRLPQFLDMLVKPPMRPFLYYIFWAAFITLAMAPYLPVAAAMPSSFFYSSGRFVTQLGNLLIGLAIAVWFFHHVSVFGLDSRLLYGVVFGTCVLVAIGIYQVLAEHLGLPINTITRAGGAQEGGALAYTTQVNGGAFRPHSFAGEPKALSVALVFAVPSLIYTFTGTRGMVRYTVLAVILSAGFLFFRTLSTAGYIILMLVLPFIYYWATSRVVTGGSVGGNRLVSAIWKMVMGLSLAMITAFLIASSEFQQRVFERVGEDGFLTYGEAGLLQAFSDRPWLMFFGAGMGGGASYIRLYEDSYYGWTASARGVIGQIGDVGLVGVVLLVGTIVVLQTSSYLKLRVMRRPSAVEGSAIWATTVLGTIMLVTYGQWYVPWLTIGLSAGLVHILTGNLTDQKSPRAR